MDNEGNKIEGGYSYSFSVAIDMLKNGTKVSRAGWNGKGQYIYLVPSALYDAQTDVAKTEFGEKVPYRAYLAIKTVQADVVPWVASQSDLLATDWYEVI